MENMFKDKVVVVTGGAKGIGRCIAEEFSKEGALVYVIDKSEGITIDKNEPVRKETVETTEIAKADQQNASQDNITYYKGDIAHKEVLETFAAEILAKHDKVHYIINNALPIMRGLDECTYEEFQYALSVGVTAPFYLVKLLAENLSEGASIINISSSRDRMSQPQTESYTAAKGGIAALTHALAVSLAGKARVNSISPGWIDTDYTVYEGPDATQQPAGRVGNPKDISNMVLFLCSDKAGFITGENICIDGGMTRLMIYHGDNGWELN